MPAKVPVGHLPDLRGRKTGILGNNGAGKTVLLSAIANHYPNCLIVDPVGSSPNKDVLKDAAPPDLQVTVDREVDQDEMRKLLTWSKQEMAPKRPVALDISSLVGPEQMAWGDTFGPVCLDVLGGTNAVVLLDEIHWLTPQGTSRQYPGLFHAVGKGRNHEVGFAFSAHQFQDPDKYLVNLASTYIVMRLRGKTSLDHAKAYIAGIWDEARARQAVERLPHFEPGQLLVVE